MHGRMHPNYWQITILLVVDLCSSLAYFMMTQPLPIAARQLPTTIHARQSYDSACAISYQHGTIMLYMYIHNYHVCTHRNEGLIV